MSDRAMVTEAIFRTEAIRVSDPDQPFWYTSGTLGPYYINTHFLFGGEAAANRLLSRIEALSAGDPAIFAASLLEDLTAQYDLDATYRGVIDAMVRMAGPLPADFVSGGERRDFFFSLPVANRLGKPHLSVFKDGRCVLADPDGGNARAVRPDAGGALAGHRALHVADIVTQAASFTRAWIPTVHSLGASMPAAMAVIDRNQDGRSNLQAAGTELHTLVDIDDTLFSAAARNGILSGAQLETVRAFNRDPAKYMRDFLHTHPDYLRGQLAAGGKSRERALLCISNGYAEMPASDGL
ncbi:MAG: hypothetical protein KBA30_03030 [Clostridia bacterium]|nr:hypothetical protein [Clostridia bacterium]